MSRLSLVLRKHRLKLSLGDDKFQIVSKAFNETFLEELPQEEYRLLEELMDNHELLLDNPTAADILELVWWRLVEIDAKGADALHENTPGFHVPELADLIVIAEFRLWRRFIVRLIRFCEENSLGYLCNLTRYKTRLKAIAYDDNYNVCFDHLLSHLDFYNEEEESYEDEVAEISKPCEAEAA